MKSPRGGGGAQGGGVGEGGGASHFQFADGEELSHASLGTAPASSASASLSDTAPDSFSIRSPE